jgi:SAM-dependent methyltransferase
VRACYYDDPLLQAAQRFAASEEWDATRSLLPKQPGDALDLGAGRGISSYALARDGWQVTALEPDSSPVVGSGAIRSLAREAGLAISVVEEYGETLPFEANTFDLVYGRQVLHHAHDLLLLCCEVARALKPGGRFIALREHVISRQEDLPAFLDNHPLHRYYGGENAYLLDEYTAAITHSGLRIQKTFGPFDNVINYFPMTCQQWQEMCFRLLSGKIGQPAARFLLSQYQPLRPWLLSLIARRLSQRSSTPGRLYSFIAEKPVQ